jgi:hypothetical protein
MKKHNFKVGEIVRVDFSHLKFYQPDVYKYWHNKKVKIMYLDNLDNNKIATVDKLSFYGGQPAFISIKYLYPISQQLMLFDI